MKGIVKWFVPVKGYGFITGEDGFSYFAHYKNINPVAGKSFLYLVEDDDVEFDVLETVKGLSAVNIIVIPKVQGTYLERLNKKLEREDN